jgi:flagellar protein FliT
MMNQLIDYRNCTKKILDLLTIQEITIDKREEIISKVNDLLERRQKLLDGLPMWPNISEMDKTEMIVAEKRLKEKMASLQAKVKDDLKKQQLRKRRMNQYNDPYGGNLSIDGMFYDKKK